jgi:hypothetical protein
MLINRSKSSFPNKKMFFSNNLAYNTLLVKSKYYIICLECQISFAWIDSVHWNPHWYLIITNMYDYIITSAGNFF